VKLVHVDRTLAIDLDAMAAAAVGAGLVYFCNPNNPTGTAHDAAAVERFVRRIKRESPETAIHIDEAYMDYTHDAAVRTASALTQELPRVFISKSLSKAHGMAGLRIGYAVGQQATVGPIAQASGLGSMNTLSAAAAIASLEDRAHIEAEVKENARVRDFTLQAFRRLGYEASEPHTNHIFLDLGRPASQFREACRSLGVEVGRDFPPMEKTHSRVSLGTMDEMRKAVEVFRAVLTAKSTL
jgi:histidinol-phosphate aminotransferase